MLLCLHLHWTDKGKALTVTSNFEKVGDNCYLYKVIIFRSLICILHFTRFIYQYCENVTERPLTGKGNGESSSSEVQFETKSWCPVDLCLQEIAHSLVQKVGNWICQYFALFSFVNWQYLLDRHSSMGGIWKQKLISSSFPSAVFPLVTLKM